MANRAMTEIASFSISPLRRPQPNRSIVKYGAATGQAGVGAGQEVDPDPLREGAVGPQPLDDHDPLLQAVERPRMDHDAAHGVADADAIAVADAEPGQRLRMHQSG